MANQSTKAIILSAALLASATASAETQPPSNEELVKLIQDLQQEVKQLKTQLADTNHKVEATSDAVEQVSTNSAATSGSTNTSIGGYGEMHYNNLNRENGEEDTREIDFHRFVLFFGHEFSDEMRFFSELEVEHSISGDGQNGEVELEQAYIQYDINDQLAASGGLFLLPVGIINETHEPPTFYGVERNDVESIIIPSTWWEGGGMLSGKMDSGFSWDFAVTSGLSIDPASLRVRSGRNKVSEAPANDLAYTGRATFTGISGLELGATLHYQGDASQVDDDGLDAGLLTEAHAAYANGPFGLRALYAQWDFDTSAAVAAATDGGDEQEGWYIEPSFKVVENVGLYTRYEQRNAARTIDRFEQWEAGVNFWPHEDVVLKFDYRDRQQDESADQAEDFQGVDLGIGYQF